MKDAKPKPRAIKPDTSTRCSICNHSWVHDFIEDSLRDTRKENEPKPDAYRIHREIMLAYNESVAKHPDSGLQRPPSISSLTRHIQRGDSPAWNEWKT